MTQQESRLAASAEALLVALTRLNPAQLDREQSRGLVAAVERLMPRLARSEAPLLVVLGGSTGVGKSTLVNSLVGRHVSRAGVLRPTTRVPVLLHHPIDAERVVDMSPSLPDPLEVVSDKAVPSGLVLLDSPDLDSVEPQNRSVAASLIETADLWVAVTSAARYADAVPWTHLNSTSARRGTTAVVLNRVPALAVGEVSTHLATLLSGAGLGDSPLVVVSEHPGTEGLLPPDAVAALRGLLTALGQNPGLRELMRRSSLSGAVADVLSRVESLDESGAYHDVRRAGEALAAARRTELA